MVYNAMGWRSCQILFGVNLGGAAWKNSISIHQIFALLIDIRLTYCELLAKLHMVKLFFIYELENENGIENIPQLEGECVEKTFEEMRNEGYVDDDLFDDMKLFFQPLTITDDELKINPDELLHADKDHRHQIKKLNKSIQELNENYDEVQKKWESIKEKLKEEILIRDKESDEHDLTMQQNMSLQERTKLNLLWCRKTDDRKKQIDIYKEQIAIEDNRMKQIETERIEKENLRNTIKGQYLKEQTQIDRSLIKLHRGFIMYGPPGMLIRSFNL
jgi:hypothetical protein